MPESHSFYHMPDNSVTGLLSLKVQDLLKKTSYDGNNFWVLDLSAPSGPVNGNKAWKLLPQIEAMKVSEQNSLLTFGGAFSNHIYQTARLCYYWGIESVGMIRADSIDLNNPTLIAARQWGMKLIPISRSDYREKNSTSFLEAVKLKFPKAAIIPEGGTNALGVRGTTELGYAIHPIIRKYKLDTVALPVGTGGTMAGIVNGLEGAAYAIGYGALKGSFLKEAVLQWVSNDCDHWKVEDDDMFGGYAKWNPELISFIKSFHQSTGLVTDPIYVGKMLFRAWKKGRLMDSTLFIHTGGQQGNLGMNQRFGLDLPTV